MEVIDNLTLAVQALQQQAVKQQNVNLKGGESSERQALESVKGKAAENEKNILYVLSVVRDAARDTVSVPNPQTARMQGMRSVLACTYKLYP